MLINGYYNRKVEFSELWKDVFSLMYNQAEIEKSTQKSRDGSVSAEVMNAVLVLEDPTRNILESKVRNLNIRYAVGELMWYLSGNPALSAIQNITSAWNRMSDDGYNVNSNYGFCIFEKFDFDQWEYVKKLLKTSPETRQAVLHIKEARDTFKYPTKDLNCTCVLQFILRENKLHLTTYMRSNDIWLGTPNDVFAFTCLQMKMAMELGVEIGTYTHIAGSLHLYTRDYEKAKAILNSLE